MNSAVPRVALWASLLVGLQACSIHPAIDDVTSYEPSDVVRKIRCEARGALTRKLKAWLASQSDDPAARSIVAELDNNVDIALVALNKLKPSTKHYIDYFTNAAIAYDFTLNMTESNGISSSFSIARLFSSGSGVFGISATADFTRNNINSFLITDTFKNLLLQIAPDYCYGQDTRTANYLYPIVGNIGLNKSIDSFIDLSLFGGLAGKDGKGPRTMSEGLEFTTKVGGSFSPTITFLPAGLGTRLASASGSGSASREDKHKVIIGLSLPEAKGPARRLTESFPGRLVNVSPNATPAELQAAEAVAQHIVRFDIPRRDQNIVYQSLLPFL